MKRRLYALLILLVTAFPLYAIDQIETREDMETFIHSYYLHPDPGMVSAAITFLGRENELPVNAIPEVVGFFSRIFNDNDSFRSKWKEEINALQGQTRSALAVAFDTSPEILLARIGLSASWNDLCWGAYFASGDTRYLQKITDQTIYGIERCDINLFFAGSSAKWSLAANARQHPSVREYLQDRIRNEGETALNELLTREPQEIRNEMENILKSQKKRGWNDAVLKKFLEETDREILRLIGQLK